MTLMIIPPAQVLLRSTVVAAALVCLQSGAMAASFLTDKPFDLTVNVGGTYSGTTDTIAGGQQPLALGFTTVEDLFNQTQNAGLSQVNALYTETSASVFALVTGVCPSCCKLR